MQQPTAKRRRRPRLTLAVSMFLAAAAAAAAQNRPAAAAVECQRASTQIELNACACEDFLTEHESRHAGSSSAQSMLQWQCATRMTRQRSAVLLHLASCREGDLGYLQVPGTGTPKR